MVFHSGEWTRSQTPAFRTAFNSLSMNPPADAETFSVNMCSGDGVDDAERSSDPGVNEE